MNSSIESLYFLESFVSFPPFAVYVFSEAVVSIVTIAFFQSEVFPVYLPTLFSFPLTVIVFTFNTLTSNNFSTAFLMSIFVAFLFTLKVYFPACKPSLLYSVTTGANIISSANIMRTPPLIF